MDNKSSKLPYSLFALYINGLWTTLKVLTHYFVLWFFSFILLPFSILTILPNVNNSIVSQLEFSIFPFFYYVGYIGFFKIIS